MRPPLSSLSSIASKLLLSLLSILLSLAPASLPQMPRFDLSSGSVLSGQPRQQPPSQGSRPRCPGPGEAPWCQCREDNSGLSVSCHNINQVNYSAVVTTMTAASILLMEFLNQTLNCIYQSFWESNGNLNI